MEKYKILVTYVEAGMGHIVSADAIAEALERYYPDEVEVERCHVFRDTQDEVLKRYEDYLVDEVKFANRHKLHFFFLLFLQKVFPPQASLRLAYATIWRLVRNRTLAVFRERQPDMVVSTHFTPAYVAAFGEKKKRDNWLSCVYVPDLNTHKWWDVRTDLTFVNNAVALADAEKLGFDTGNVYCTGFVLRKMVRECTRDKVALREKLGLPRKNFTVVIASGAYAEGKMAQFAEALAGINATYTLLIVAGKNDDVYEKFAARVGNCGKIDLRVYRFLPDIHELYGAADLFVTKAGPNAILDSVAMGTPILTDFYSGPIEKITRDLYVDKYHVGVHIGNPVSCADFVSECISNPALLEPYRDNCLRFRREHTGKEKRMADAIVYALRQRRAHPEFYQKPTKKQIRLYNLEEE